MISGAGKIGPSSERYGYAHVDRQTMMINGANPMPVILWLLGVPLTLVLVLMLAGVVHF